MIFWLRQPQMAIGRIEGCVWKGVFIHQQWPMKILSRLFLFININSSVQVWTNVASIESHQNRVRHQHELSIHYHLQPTLLLIAHGDIRWRFQWWLWIYLCLWWWLYFQWWQMYQKAELWLYHRWHLQTCKYLTDIWQYKNSET